MVIPCYSQSELNITVETNRTTYYVGETAIIYGNLTLYDQPITDALVAVQISDARGTPIVIRTVNTGTTPSNSFYVFIASIFASDAYGNPKNTFSPGELAYFNITVLNVDIEPRLTLITVNAYDQNNMSLASGSIKTLLPESTFTILIISVPISAEAANGTAIAYANAYTDWPMLGGVPYCPERKATFTINSTNPTSPTTIETVNANYNVIFKIPTQVAVGNFTAHVTSTYQGFTTYNSTIFRVKILGDINGDDTCNYKDLWLLLYSYGSKEGDPKYNPEADFNRDSWVNYRDLWILLKNYGKKA